MFKYDRDTGNEASIGDAVKVCHTNSTLDGKTGRIGGWGDYFEMLAIVILDEKYRYSANDCEVEAISIPVACLKPLF